jgi:3-methyladenine DNA glycosylase/8-oxoguanine DNA glycosylase
MNRSISFEPYEIEQLLQKEPLFIPWVEKIGAIIRNGNDDAYTSLIDSVLAQQVSGSAAASITKRFADKFDYDPKSIASASLEELRACGLSSNKAKYVQGIAMAKLDKTVPFNKLHEKSDQEIADYLLKLKGVGPWTVDMMLIFTFFRKDVLSYPDFGIRKGICRLYGIDALDQKCYEQIRTKLSPHLTLASFWLWEIAGFKE